MARILVADDEPAILDVIRLTCGLDGHEVEAHDNVEAAVAAFVEFRPDLLILDVNMPPSGGARQILERLDALGGTGESRVIIVTGGLVDEEAAGLTSEARVKSVIGKPFEITTMRDAVQGALGSSVSPEA